MSHQHLEVPRFPRGFLLSEHPVSPPPTFIAGPILDNFYVHPWANIETAGDSNLFVIVIGHAVPTRSGQVQPPGELLLACLRDGESTFLAALDDYGGRYAIIFGSAGNIRVVNDATGMRSVFYAAKGGMVASHALLVEQALGEATAQGDLVFAYGYPGNRTPYARTKILTPNTYYWMTANLVRRFWPVSAPVPRDVDAVAALALETASTAMRNIAKSLPVKMALTAGIDSRVILAVGLQAGIEFETYTYGRNSATALDRSFAPDLAAHAGVKHNLVRQVEKSEQLQARLSEANYSSHHAGAVPGLMKFYNVPDSVAVTGNLLEIGRSFYRKYRARGVAPPVTASSMAHLHFLSMTSKSQAKIEQYGLTRFYETSEHAFQGFIDDTGHNLTTGLVDPFDQFYWEHRMGTWHGPAMVERDFYGVAFIPFNSRRIFDAMLGVGQQERDSSAVFFRLIEMVDPSLLDLPVNPKRWRGNRLV